MEPLAVRWISLLFVIALAALAGWAFADAARRPRSDASGPVQETAAGQPALAVHRPGLPAELVRIEDGLLVGRGPGCHIVFDDATVSKEHARVHVDERSIMLEDLHSTNGTLVNGKAIVGPTVIRHGDRIAIGRNVIVFASET